MFANRLGEKVCGWSFAMSVAYFCECRLNSPSWESLYKAIPVKELSMLPALLFVTVSPQTTPP